MGLEQVRTYALLLSAASRSLVSRRRAKLISPEAPASQVVRAPSALDLKLPPLRDLALHASYGALVDARGDVYQWGDAHFGSRSVDNREPMPTLRGKVRHLSSTSQ